MIGRTVRIVGAGLCLWGGFATAAGGADVGARLRAAPGDVGRAPKRLAVCVGIETFRDNTISPLSASDHDARKMGRQLKQKCGLTEEPVVLCNEQATLGALRKAIAVDLPRKTAPGDTVFLYFSTHGGQCRDEDHDEADGWDEFIVPYDGKLNAPAGTMLLDDTFARWLADLPGRHVAVILDCCHSGGAAKGPGAPRTDPPVLQFIDGEAGRRRPPGFKDNSQPGVMVLAASRAEQRAFVMADGGGGVLTSFLVGAVGDDGTDTDRDGVVTPAELFRAVQQGVSGYAKVVSTVTQTPLLIDNASGLVIRRVATRRPGPAAGGDRDLASQFVTRFAQLARNADAAVAGGLIESERVFGGATGVVTVTAKAPNVIRPAGGVGGDTSKVEIALKVWMELARKDSSSNHYVGTARFIDPRTHTWAAEDTFFLWVEAAAPVELVLFERRPGQPFAVVSPEAQDRRRFWTIPHGLPSRIPRSLTLEKHGRDEVVSVLVARVDGGSHSLSGSSAGPAALAEQKAGLRPLRSLAPGPAGPHPSTPLGPTEATAACFYGPEPIGQFQITFRKR